MQLRIARLCLDCEDIHDSQRCPVCASETFSYLTKWVPVEERRARPRRPVKLFRPTKTQTIMFGGGVVSLLTYWLIRSSNKIQDKALGTAGELR
jgi:hypothetical protein